jgi:hypothetical protein
MTGPDILEIFARLQAKFTDRRYKGAEVNAVWAGLLPCCRESMEWAAGVLMKSAKSLPQASTVLELTVEQERRMVGSASAAPSVNKDDRGREALKLMIRFNTGEISEKEWIAEMYRMSEKYRDSEFAAAARGRDLSRQEV